MKVLLIACALFGATFARPKALSLVITEDSNSFRQKRQSEDNGGEDIGDDSKPVIQKLHVHSNISYRYAKTEVESYIKNPSTDNAKEVSFEMVLPEKAFISNFSIETGNKVYVSRVEKKKEANEIFEKAVSSGQTAGLVNQREGNIFSVTTNVAAAEKLTFRLTYEQLLVRKLSKYEHAININPGQVVNDMEIKVYINETLPLTQLKVPELRQSNEIFEDEALNSDVTIEQDSNTATITYKPTAAEQKELATTGVSGQFVVEYDVDRKNQNSDIQVYDGYLVHFFVPENDLSPLPKHVTFVLDTSGSMSGTKITQLQDAMVSILGDLKSSDYFSIIEFNSEIKHWQSKSEEETDRPIYNAKEDVVLEAMTEYIVNLEAGGGTNINEALIEAIEVTKKAKSELPINALPMIIFLTDGQPTEGESNGNKIKENIKEINDDIPIYGLAFGSGADFSLIKDISTDNQAFARKIFESSDATIQLENFYAEISSPLLKDISFTYVGDDGLDTAENVLPGATFHKGSEFISVVKMGEENQLPTSLRVNGQSFESPDFNDVIYPCIYKGEDDHSDLDEEENDENREEDNENVTDHDIEEVQLRHIHHCIPHPFPPAPQSPPSFIERLWAFLTIEKLLDEKADNKNMTEEDREEKATEIALKYNFVTDLTSLVVVKPKSPTNENGTESISEDASVLDLRPVEDQKFLGFNTKSNFQFNIQSSGCPTCFMSFNKNAFQAVNVHSLLMSSPPLRRGAVNNRKRTRPTNFSQVKIAQANVPTVGLMSADVDSPSFSAATTTTPATTTTQCPKIDCKIELFSKTLFRGDKIEVTADMEELGDFDNKAQSIKVSGTCSWKVFVDESNQGVSQTFMPGEYRNAATIKLVLKKASSVQNIGC